MKNELTLQINKGGGEGAVKLLSFTHRFPIHQRYREKVNGEIELLYLLI